MEAKTLFFSDLRRILGVLDHSMRRRAGLILCLMFVNSLFELGFVLTLTGMGMAVANAEALRQNIFYRGLFHLFPSLGAWSSEGFNMLLLSGLVVVATSALKNILGFAGARSIALLGEDISLQVEGELMRRFLHMEYAWHLSPASGKILQVMGWRSALSSMLTHLLNTYACALTILLLFLCLAGNEPVLTFLVLGVASAAGIALYAAVRKSVDHNAKIITETDRDENRALLQATRGIREVLVYRRQDLFLEHIRAAAVNGRKARIFTRIASALPTWILEVTGFVLVVAAIFFMVYVQKADAARITGALAMLVLTAWRILPMFNRIVSLHIAVRALRPKTEGVLVQLEQLCRTPFRMAPEPAPGFSFPQEIVLDGVSFSYPGAKVLALNHVRMQLRKGQKIGLIGASGAGKSTLAGMLCGLLRPKEGRILLDGSPMTPEQGAALAMRTGFVPQNPFLFAGTLAENITFGSGDAPVDKTRLLGACALAAIDFAESHPKGLNRPIGNNGEGLSGGQAQRVAIARALYMEPELLIFDEATSALDQANENAIRQTLDVLPGNVTCVIIAHRLATVEHCDQIVWLDKGKVIMQDDAHNVLAAYRSATQGGTRNTGQSYSQPA